MDNLEILKLKSQGLCCSQIMVRLVLDLLGRDNPDLVHFARGLCMGYGSNTGDCGILTAGICILALYLPGDPELCAGLQGQFLDDFRTWTGANSNGADGSQTTCRGIAGEYYPQMHPSACGELLSRAHGRILEILVENGVDPADPEA